jgi:hypothetical protein
MTSCRLSGYQQPCLELDTRPEGSCELQFDCSDIAVPHDARVCWKMEVELRPQAGLTTCIGLRCCLAVSELHTGQ